MRSVNVCRPSQEAVKITHLRPLKTRRWKPSIQLRRLMNLPLSWLASALPANVAIRASSQAWKGTSQFFGHLVSTNPSAPTTANGPSDPAQGALRDLNLDHPKDRLKQVQKRLESLLQSSRSAFGISGKNSDEQPLTISVSRSGEVIAVGQEPIRTNVEVQIQTDSKLLRQLKELGQELQGMEIQVG
jgi:hypothetical protein